MFDGRPSRPSARRSIIKAGEPAAAPRKRGVLRRQAPQLSAAPARMGDRHAEVRRIEAVEVVRDRTHLSARAKPLRQATGCVSTISRRGLGQRAQPADPEYPAAWPRARAPAPVPSRAARRSGRPAGSCFREKPCSPWIRRASLKNWNRMRRFVMAGDEGAAALIAHQQVLDWPVRQAPCARCPG